MTILSIATREVVTADRETSILQIAKLMRRHNVGDVIITEKTHSGEKPIGIITDRDLVVEILAEEVSIDAVTIGDALCYHAILIQHQDSIASALKILNHARIRRAPIVDDNGVLCAIVSVDDIMRYYAQQIARLAEIYLHHDSGIIPR